ncbi:MAG TPA: heparan-alpha-glucosaminide N-acetyltransferase domain-containing protein [Longimicrobium sp.]|nr:heparan-alpha-glucosaminide N-acetyltransferase domain-containing protein [Longimicrobium sp.]
MSTIVADSPQRSAGSAAGVDPAPQRMRVDAVDLLRGLVMVIMLLDHTRDFVHRDALLFDPSDLSRTTPALFFTRWITHYCAPVFVFLAGTGAYLQLRRGKTKAELSRFLWTRGLWLMVLELTVVRCVVAFNLDYPSFPGFLQVIWAIGVSMIVLAALIHLPLRAVAAIGIGIIALHNLADGIAVQGWRGPGSAAPDALGAIWMMLHQPGFIVVAGVPVLILYPILAWIGVMAAGYAFGAVYDWEPERRRRFLVRLGLGMIVAFIVIRATNLYGDPREWSAQKDGVFTVLSFLNVTKYPPSLLFLLMTLGPAILSLAWFERLGRGPVGRALVTYGRVPLFFYVLQWITAHFFAIVFSLMAGKSIAHLFEFPGTIQPPPTGVGFGLGITYLAWFLGIALTYPLCRWFAGVKRRRKEWWLSYL